MSLTDITNTADISTIGKGVNKRKRLSDGSIKQYHYEKIRKNFELVFSNNSEKLQFENKLEAFKKQHGLKSVKEVFDHVLSDNVSETSDCYDKTLNYREVLNNAKHENFICENYQILELVRRVCQHQQNCNGNLVPTEINHHGHVAGITWNCSNGHILKWESSSVLGKNYTVNYRTMLAYLCSGMNQIEYDRFCDFSQYGILTDYFRIQAVFTFSAIISVLAKESIYYALLDEIDESKDKKEDGISIMTDARHQCRKNSYHTDHVALGLHTHKVVNIQHIDKEQERSTQRHETLGCEKMYEDFERQNVKVNIHVHDRNMSVNKSIKAKDNVRNCNERWHATKPISQGMKKISSGANKNKGRTWHPQLADKGARLRNHMYYAIDNCGGNPDILRQSIDSCVLHFQDNHNNCAPDSACRQPNYVPDFTILQEPVAVRLLTDFIHSLTLYKNAADYALCKDTFYIESFNNTCLVYLNKRIHYKNQTYLMRRNLAVLSWNEHVDRPYTSRWNRLQVHHNRRGLGKKAYKKKTYSFVNDIWTMLIRIISGDENLPELNVDNPDGDEDHYEEDEI
ncbi:MAG: hypothetical protein AB2693_25165 [Candidatus Thiodiazotropha sp.]